MKEIADKKIILWDFDGVILDSMEIREEGFRRTLESFPTLQIEELLSFHRENGGLSRYVKFKYFLEQIRGEERNEKKIEEWADGFSRIMREKLTSKEHLIGEVIDYIKKNKERYIMHIVSGSDENELRFLCYQLGISSYFESIQGSPTPKIDIVKGLMEKYNYKTAETCLIGDSINDFDASKSNKIEFFGYNNPVLKEKGLRYINSFE